MGIATFLDSSATIRDITSTFILIDYLSPKIKEDTRNIYRAAFEVNINYKYNCFGLIIYATKDVKMD